MTQLFRPTSHPPMVTFDRIAVKFRFIKVTLSYSRPEKIHIDSTAYTNQTGNVSRLYIEKVSIWRQRLSVSFTHSSPQKRFPYLFSVLQICDALSNRIHFWVNANPQKTIINPYLNLIKNNINNVIHWYFSNKILHPSFIKSLPQSFFSFGMACAQVKSEVLFSDIFLKQKLKQLEEGKQLQKSRTQSH